jgi:hypothetical protein
MSTKAIAKLLTLAADAERAAAAYRLAAAALNGHAVDQRAARSATILDAALELDAERRAPKPKPKQIRTGDHTRKIRAQRARTARQLAHLEKPGPLTAAAWNEAAKARIGIPALLNAGYLKTVGDKYARTAKVYDVEGRRVAK